jgi:hypothetical protein
MTQAYVRAGRARVRNIPLECRGFSGTDPSAKAGIYRYDVVVHRRRHVLPACNALCAT